VNRRSGRLATGHPWSAFIQSSTLRLALLYMLMFLVSVSLLLGFIYWSTAGYMSRQADATIETEIEGLAEQYRSRGLEGLASVMRERVARNPSGESLYLFASADYRALAGNLDRWPNAEPDEQGWITFPLRRAADASGARSTAGESEPGHLGRARVFALRGGLHLLVGRDIRELEEVRSLVLGAIAWGLALTAGLAALGGLTMSWRTAKRIESINETSREIMRGDLSQRVPTRGSGDDFDQLAENLNAMLERIQALMSGVREVSDNVAHDLKTPLARLRSRLEALHRALDAKEAEAVIVAGELHELSHGALNEADRLLSMFDAVLRIARIESGAQQLRRQEIDVSRVLHDVFELYEPVAEDRGLTLHFGVEGTLRANVDPELLFQAFGNVVENAIKYTPLGGQIMLAAQHDAHGIHVLVKDTGPGVPEADRERVFGRFHRLEASRSTPGNGLGLSLVAAIMAMHGGSTELEENQPTGLVVRLILPD